MGLFSFFRKKKKPKCTPYSCYQLPQRPIGVSGNSLKNLSSSTDDDYWERRRRESNNQTALDSIISGTPGYIPNDSDYTPPSSNDSHFGGYGGGDSGGGGASGSWDSGSSDSGSYDSGSSDSGGGCDSGSSSD